MSSESTTAVRGRPVLGAIFGPLAYWAGARLGAVELPQDHASLIAVAIEWAVAMPLVLLMVRLSERFNARPVDQHAC